MAKGQRGKQTNNGPGSAGAQNAPRNNKMADKENSNDTHNLQSKGRNRNREKAKLISDEQKPEALDDPSSSPSNHVGEKKDGVPHTVHSKVQPTTEQLMIAKIIDHHSDDPHQRKKIQQVMDVTGKPEDEVATALFDASWDESRAIELLLEDGDHLSAWEETGKKKKAKKSANDVIDKDNTDSWDQDDSHHPDPREKSRNRGPPRMRRGGSNAKGGRDNAENGDQVVPSGGRGGRRNGGDRGDRRRNGDRMGDRDRRDRGGDPGGDRGPRTFVNNRQQSQRPEQGAMHHGGPGGERGGNAPPGDRGQSGSGFQGSIDTWNNPNDQNSSDHRDDRSGPGPGGPHEGRPRGPRSGPRGGPRSKDAFENAGNWGDDFPQADDWDNEEYTGSLADTKVFTAKQKTPPGGSQAPQQPASNPQQPAVANPASGGQNRGFSGGLANGPAAQSYSQSIDLSTLLQKPTTQSSVGSSTAGSTSAAPGAQFNQAATESLKAVVGMGGAGSGANVAQSQSSQPPKDNSSLYSYAAQAASAFNPINKSNNPQAPIRQQPNQPQVSKPSQAVGGPRGPSRMPPPPTGSSSKAPAVEMPGDSLGRLDVQFGGLDLQFGGSTSANSTGNTDPITGSGFEFGTGSDDKVTGSGPVAPVNTSKPDSFAPTAKEVNKSLSNALSSGGNLNPPVAPKQGAAAPQTTDSFSKTTTATPGAPATTVASTPLNPSASNNSGFNKPNDLGGYSGYNNYNKGYNNYQYQYPNSNSFSSQQGQGSTQGSSQGSQYKTGGQFDKYDPQLSNQAAAVLGLQANTNTTNALSGKVSATTASKVNMPNLPPGVASMLHPQYMAAGLAPAFYGLQQPAAAMYGAYGNTGLEDLAAIQRASASAAGLHTLPTTGYYDPNNQFAATSLGAAVANRDGNTNLANLNSLAAGIVSTNSSSTGNSGSTIGSTSGFGSNTTSTSAGTGSAVDSNTGSTSGNPAVSTGVSSGNSSGITGSATAAGSGSSGNQQHVQQQQQSQQQQQQQQTAFNLAATNAFAAQQVPPGYAYYFGNMGNMSLQPAYGGATPGHVYQPQAMTVPGAGATATSQFQKSYGTSYGSGYDTLGQQANKDFGSNYSSNGQSKSTGGSAAAAGTGKGAHQYWGNTLTSTLQW